jgi:hypothetical protein
MEQQGLSVVKGSSTSDYGVGVSHQPPDDGDGARGGGDDLSRMLSEAETELELIERLGGISPLRQLVTPRGIELRATKLIRLDGVEHQGGSPVRPLDHPLRGVVRRTEVLRMTGEEPGRTLDHDVSRIRGRLGNKSDARAASTGERSVAADPFTNGLGPGARLAEPSSGKDQPSRPVALRL